MNRVTKEKQMKNFSGTLELFDFSVRRLANGNKVRLIFEAPENLDVEKQLIEFRGEYVNLKAKSIEEDAPKIELGGLWEVFDLKCRRLRNGDKLRITLETTYNKELEKGAVELRFHDCEVSFEKTEEEFDFEDDEEDL